MDILPSVLFLEHSPDSKFPDINSVPESPDERIDALTQQDSETRPWTEEVVKNQQELQRQQSPRKRIYNDSDWSIDEEL